MNFHSDGEEARAVLSTWLSKLATQEVLRLIEENEVLADLLEYKFLKVKRSFTEHHLHTAIDGMY